MSSIQHPDFLVIGAGIIGLSTALELKQRFPDASIIIIEKETGPGLHASGRNSGVLHAGFYYTADSLKAKLCREGNAAWRSWCEEEGLTINRCGKLVVARDESELVGLDELFRRGSVNGVELEMITATQATDIEPMVNTYERALWSPTTATINPVEVVTSICDKIKVQGTGLLTDTAYLRRDADRVVTSRGLFSAGYVINTAGLYADHIALDFGFSTDYRILPFKGLYLYANDKGLQLRTNVYPVPDLNNPFLGVHFTVTAENRTKIGPTAIPAFWRENYSGLTGFNLGELITIAGIDIRLLLSNDFGFRDLALKEIQKYSRMKLVKLAGSLIKHINQEDFTVWGKPGIRAQLYNTRTRTLEMDFRFEADDHSLHVLNAVSPAFTCAIPFGRLLVDEIESRIS